MLHTAASILALFFLHALTRLQLLPSPALLGCRSDTLCLAAGAGHRGGEHGGQCHGSGPGGGAAHRPVQGGRLCRRHCRQAGAVSPLCCCCCCWWLQSFLSSASGTTQPCCPPNPSLALQRVYFHRECLLGCPALGQGCCPTADLSACSPSRSMHTGAYDPC